MKVYIHTETFYNHNDTCSCAAGLVRAELHTDGETFGVHHPENGYSRWPADEFKKTHRELTAKERQLINFTTAELEVMGISDGQPPGEL